jgi:hypothetical protein
MMVADSICVEMRRKITAWHGRNGRKAINVHHSYAISTASRLDILDNPGNNSRRLVFSVKAGDSGKECSWTLERLISVNVRTLVHVVTRKMTDYLVVYNSCLVKI